MKNPLETFPYDWTLALARDLHLALCALYPNAKSVVGVAQQAGIQAWDINQDQTPYFVWKDVLELAARAGILRTLTTVARDCIGNGKPGTQLLDDLLADRPIVSASVRGVNGEAPYDESIGEEEAKLFHDDLTLSVGKVRWMIGVLEKLRSLSPAVCRLECTFKGRLGKGTGFRIGPNLLLTNWHVLHNLERKLDAETVVATFGFEEDEAGTNLQGTEIECDPASIVVGSQDADWGVVRAKTPLPEGAPIIKLSEAVDPVRYERAFLIQHPEGDRKRLGFVRNDITEFDDSHLYYLTDTQHGSSGSPVFDDRGRLIGVHHFGGAPQEVVGKPPLKKNRGVRIPKIIAGLAAAGIGVT